MVAYILIFMGVVFFATTVVLLFKFYFTNRRRMTSYTQGRVLTADERVVVDKDMRRTETEILAAYSASGKEFQVRRVIQGAKGKLFPPGRPVQVRYNPGEPDMSELAL
jgi:hypothetical protein